MVENCLQVAVFCVCGAIFAVLLRQHVREQSLLAALGICAGVMIAFLEFAAPLLNEIRDIFTEAGVSDSYISLIFKAAAVCFITQLTCDLCRDSGESAIASAAELWGRGAVVFISLPIVRALLERINAVL